jgi:hypothetical protein
MLSNVWVENCIVEGGQYMGALIGHFITPGTSITDCVVKDIDMKPYPQLGVKAGALVGLAASGNAWHCAVHWQLRRDCRLYRVPRRVYLTLP